MLTKQSITHVTFTSLFLFVNFFWGQQLNCNEQIGDWWVSLLHISNQGAW